LSNDLVGHFREEDNEMRTEAERQHEIGKSQGIVFTT